MKAMAQRSQTTKPHPTGHSHRASQSLWAPHDERAPGQEQQRCLLTYACLNKRVLKPSGDRLMGSELEVTGGVEQFSLCQSEGLERQWKA